MKIIIFCCACVFSILTCTGLQGSAAEWRLPIGLSYISGLGDVNNLHDDNLKAEGYSIGSHKFTWPLGITFQPYLQFDNGLGFGMGLGPCMFSLGGDYSFSNIPVGADLRYTTFQAEDASPYGRIGVHYNIASGDYVKSSSPSLFGSIGYEFRRNRSLGGGVEIAYDMSEIEFEKYGPGGNDTVTETIKPYGIILSLFMTF